MYKEKIVNIETKEETWRDFTENEIAEVEAEKAKTLAKAQAKTEATAQRQALLDKLGITEDEARLLLGGN